MNTHSMCFSQLLRTIALIGLLTLVGSYTPANAAQGCGHGLHRTLYGWCVLNRPGPHATPAPYHPGCWRNAWGQLRCYR